MTASQRGSVAAVPEASVGSLLQRHWVVGALFMAAALGALVPLLVPMWSLEAVLIYLHGPLYMLHQVEEHWDDRFRRFVNMRVFGGLEALSPRDVVWINCGVVWGLNLAALYCAVLVAPDWALVAPYAVLVNAIAHIAAALARREYNPGLVSAIVLFLPVAAVTLARIGGSPLQHGVGLGIAIGLHIAIVVVTGRNVARAKAGSQ